MNNSVSEALALTINSLAIHPNDYLTNSEFPNSLSLQFQVGELKITLSFIQTLIEQVYHLLNKLTGNFIVAQRQSGYKQQINYEQDKNY